MCYYHFAGGDPNSDSDFDFDSSDSDSSSSEDFRLQSTGIVMVSPPESLEQKDESTSHDLYQTPPEESATAASDDGIASVAIERGYMDNDGTKAVDLGRDTDLGLFSETQQTDEIIHVEPEDEEEESIRIIGVCRSNGSESDELEPQSKKLKLSEEKSEVEANCKDGTEKINSEEYQSKEKQDSGEASEAGRVLPPSISGVVKNNSSRSGDGRKLTILDILKILKDAEKRSDEDEDLSKLSLLEVAKRSGMTFPRPRWWPEGGFETK